MSKSESLVFNYGTTDVVESLRLVPTSFGELGPTQVFVEFLAVPINPLDLLVLHEQYPVKPQSHVPIGNGESYPVPGSDGAARVLQMGTAVPDLQIGDVVIVRTHCQGTWRTHAQLEASHVLKVPSGLDPRHLALLRMGVLPAFFLLQDYHPLSPGDWIIMNAATGTVSHFVSQIAQLYGVNVVSVIRDRSDDGERERTERSLKSHGAGVVMTESQLTTTEALAGKRIVLGIDFVSDDKLTAAIAGVLAPGATLLTAGFLGPASAPEVNLRKLLWERISHSEPSASAPALTSGLLRHSRVSSIGWGDCCNGERLRRPWSTTSDGTSRMRVVNRPCGTLLIKPRTARLVSARRLSSSAVS